MKEKILILIFFFFSFNAFSQYQSYFGNYQTSWKLLDVSILEAYEFSINVIGDTLINDSLWKIIKCYNYYSYFFEDTTKGLLLEKDSLLGNIIICDLTLQVGDSIIYYCSYTPYMPPYYIVVDSVFIDNYGRKIIQFNYFFSDIYLGDVYIHEKFRMIEGVGMNQSIIKNCVGCSSYLMCQTKDSILNYITPLFDSCDVISNIPNKIQIPSNDIKIYPNPTYKNVIIENADHSIINIYDINGKKIKKIKNLKNKKIFNIEFLHQGIFIIEIIKNNCIYKEKIVVIKN